MYKKVFLSPVYISFHIFDRIFLSETYLNSETSSDEVSKYLFTNEKKLQLSNWNKIYEFRKLG